MSDNSPYFTWNGYNSRPYLWIQKYPPIVKPQERYQQITIPGRPGMLTLTEGKDIYEPYIRECEVMVKPVLPSGKNLQWILKWLSGRQEVTFGCDPNFKQTARIYDQAEFQRVFADQRSATLRFLCDPFKKPSTGDTTLTMSVSSGSAGNYTLTDQGDVIAYPKFELTATGTVSIFVNGTELALKELTPGLTAIVDSETRMAYHTQTVNGVTTVTPIATYGDFPTFYNTGTMLIQWSTGFTSLKITPRWRWL